jgi:hypothetical protein
MSEVCPKCGAKRQNRVHYRYWECDSYIYKAAGEFVHGYACLKAQLTALQSQLELERWEKGELVAKLLEGIDLRLQHYDVERAKEVDSLAAGNEDADPCAWGYAKIAVIGVREDIKRLAALTPQESPDGR